MGVVWLVGTCHSVRAMAEDVSADGAVERPVHEVSANVGIPYEALQGVRATAELPYESRGTFARIGAAIRRMVVGVAGPERALEPQHAHDDVVGMVAVFAPLIVLVWIIARHRIPPR